MLTPKQRVLNTLNYKGHDRMATFYQATPEFDAELRCYMGLVERADLEDVLGVDMKTVAPRYIGPELRHFEDGSWEGIWGERYNNIPHEYGAYPEAVYLPYAGITSVDELKKLCFPSADWYDYSDLSEQCDNLAGYAICYGSAGMPDFMNGIARCRGVGQVLLDVGSRDPVYMKLIEKRHEFFYEWCERGLDAAGGKIDIVALGEDYGTQRGLMVSPRSFDKLFRPFMQEYFDLAHKYGATAMMHSCGSVRELIPRFIDMGLDILDVVQVDAAGMSVAELHREFYGKIVLRGSMSVQSTLPFGTKEDVRREVALRQELYRDGGMIIGPTHAIQPLTPVENVLEMYRAIGSLAAVQPPKEQT
jgi:uroporphyrinogen decarboxylase